MKYFSLKKIAEPADFREATIMGQAPDMGLFFPESIPVLNPDFITSLPSLSTVEIGFAVMKPYVDGIIPDDILKNIIEETLSFDIPLVRIKENIYALELFHGPTLAFKDVGARFMSRCLGYFSKKRQGHIIVLVATSGDTGGAVADGFFGVDGVDVVILYPSGKVSPVQELQLTTFGSNIHALEVNGDFDACQRIVKQAFADKELTGNLFLTSANSINIARWLPQQIYYFLALKQWPFEQPPVFSVPSGNFGNICAGILAWKSGLPVSHFIAACNVNDTVPVYLQTGEYTPVKAKPTISNAMDVGDPSNFSRIMQIFDHSLPMLKQYLSSYSISDSETAETIEKVFQHYNYLLDPHGAVGYLALEKYIIEKQDVRGIILETAHPVKFPESIEKITGKAIPFPEQVQKILGRQKKSTLIEPDFQLVKEFLLSVFGRKKYM
jgi:threonine synthase